MVFQAQMSRKRMKILTGVLLVAVALGLSGCGKRARYLDPPDPEYKHQKYPANYPPKDEQGTHY
ncbi:MAG TPA: hypothetical protein VH722_01195 [Alphaproteobacteria bacterium]|jgi:hypothetical protein|nr:hypothetical protein [Alphaproteobacteria bacterium]